MILAPVAGSVHPLDYADDPAFAMLGAGVSIEPEGSRAIVLAPVNGTIASLHPHAFAIDDGAVERALYLLEGEAQLDGADIPDKHLVLLDSGTRPVLRAKTPLKAMLLGGEPLDGPRHLWWNFVSSSKERIEQAKLDWLEGRFGQVPGETEFIPLPQR